MPFIIETRGLAYSYENGEPALKGVTLGISEGKKTVILGPNGSGKSTLFLHMNGVLRPGKGIVLYEGEPLRYDNKSLASLRQKVGLVFQNPDDQIFASTVEEDVAFGPLNLGLPRADVEERVEAALDIVDMAGFRSRPAQQLSFGQRKRVAIAGALAMDPRVLLMDEPTAGLDAQMVREILELTEELNYKGKTLVISTHDVDLAYEWADDVILMSEGSVLFSGTVDGLFEGEELLHKARLTRPILYSLNLQRHLRTGHPECPRPRTVPECCQSFFKKETTKEAGTFYIACLSHGNLDAGTLQKFRKHNRGAYGSYAKRVSRELGLDIHHYFSSIEHGLIKTSMGEDYLLITEPSLAGLVKSKVEQFDRRWNCKIKAIVIGNGY
ncbi:cobalt transport protein ATP-binding subunit [Methanocella conradii HZ254]|uniref:ABC transporter ATP-binding protein n=1 Tax=Methanocella conradii (strain DSM 24694 / JCM 17849 / CGMCC 1.5162 / HZ254) TaxID=1041930 RepID=H8IAR8_METCZ|nr:ATP-binding cassette domain-containing protein [Methanocella conradii]AFD00573.1 cobalt transport protein ATP-binding subunit [Methanocella conradii HZ254]MDI6896269.1 ATP-binding cassette domain-containing protein [Methanocella conradii]